MGLFEKLMEIQHELKVPKGQLNKFGGYKYRSCEDILEGLKPLLYLHKLAISISDEVQQIGGRNYVRAAVTLMDAESGETLCNTAFAREEESKKGMDGSQITGASSSYARKYALNGMFGIDDTEDSDATNDHGKGEQSSGQSRKSSLPICRKCGLAIESGKKKDGSIATPEEVAKLCDGMCVICYREEQKGA